MHGKKFDRKESITEWENKATEHFVNNLQSSEENIKELLYEQFGLTDEKISELMKLAEIMNEKVDYMIHQNRKIINLMSSQSLIENSLNKVSRFMYS